MKNNMTDKINSEFKTLVARSFNVAGFIDNIKREWEIQHYNNGAKIFEWILRYESIHKIEEYVDDVKSYTITSGGWNFPLLINRNAKLAFIFMKESNLTLKRNEINSAKKKSHTIQSTKPPHYAVRLSKLNKEIATQLSLDLEESKTPYEIIKAVCPNINEHDVPDDLKLMIVTFETSGDDLIKITSGFYDQNLLEIDSEDWSQFINSDYSTLLDTKFNKEKIQELNNKIEDIEQAKDDLTEFIDDIEVKENK